jgi:nicotinamide-nucleotide amidase
MAVRDGLVRRHQRETFSLDGETIDDQVAKLLRESGLKLGLAESCTGGGLAARITNPPGASDYLVGSVVAYACSAKEELLGVPEALLKEFGAVSPECAEAMAAGALKAFDADIAVSITGIAGPGGGTEKKPVGYVCFNARLKSGEVIARDPVIPGDRSDIRERSALVAMHMLRDLLS